MVPGALQVQFEDVKGGSGEWVLATFGEAGVNKIACLEAPQKKEIPFWELHKVQLEEVLLVCRIISAAPQINPIRRKEESRASVAEETSSL